MTTMTTSPAPTSRSSAISGSGTTANGRGASPFDAHDTFVHRHIGPDDVEIAEMLKVVGCASLEDLTDKTVPASIRLRRSLQLPGASDSKGEHELIAELRAIASQNQVFRSCIGMGYSGTFTPPVIQRNILENPGWYTQYTPYQAEISQGRLEALLNFQTMVSDLTGLPLAGASLLDEGTAAAEAMAMCFSIAGADGAKNKFIAAADCHPQTLGVLRTRAESLGIELVVAETESIFNAKPAKPAEAPKVTSEGVCGVLVQYPTTDGRVECYEELTRGAHAAGAMVVVATDLLALTLLRAPGEWGGGGENGADIAVGSSQRFGVPMGYGGPHAAFIATKTEYARKMPGRIIGVSRDAMGNPALRMAIQTREQHIRREKATSNICTAQALLAIMAGMYGVYHGPEGLKVIAKRVRGMTQTLRAGLLKSGHQIAEDLVFDTLRVRPTGRTSEQVLESARARRINLRDFGDGTLGVSLDETTTREDVASLLSAFGSAGGESVDALAASARLDIPPAFARTSAFMSHPVFNTHHSETEMLRYIFQLQNRDLSLTHSMIPLGSCTMKLNATSEMLPVTWPEFCNIHPFAPLNQTRGYQKLFADLELWLPEITGFTAVSLQPNAGSQGEYAGLMVIRAYHHARGQANRDVCLIPDSAHGTNPASAVIAGFKVVAVANKPNGDIDLDDLKAQIAAHKANLGALMVTYPSTYGVFEEHIKEICTLVHGAGGQVYMDGANMNAQVGVCRPGDIGADVCHLNLHKTFCIPHGGGGPGMGPIGVVAHLAPFLPGHPVVSPFADPSPGQIGECAIGPVSAATWGSPAILTIPWVYIALMGAAGLKRATQVAILNANYMAKRLEAHFPVLFRGKGGFCAHEFIIDCNAFDKSAGVKTDDIAKRLMDYGFHAPTMSWPVPGTLMIEPTESEPKAELDRLVDALIAIRAEIKEIEEGRGSRTDNPLRHAPHPIRAVVTDEWTHAYPREQAAYPKGALWLAERKFWPPVARVDNPYGDRNLVCTCPPMSAYGH